MKAYRKQTNGIRLNDKSLICDMELIYYPPHSGETFGWLQITSLDPERPFMFRRKVGTPTYDRIARAHKPDSIFRDSDALDLTAPETRLIESHPFGLSPDERATVECHKIILPFGVINHAIVEYLSDEYGICEDAEGVLHRMIENAESRYALPTFQQAWDAISISMIVWFVTEFGSDDDRAGLSEATMRAEQVYFTYPWMKTNLLYQQIKEASIREMFPLPTIYQIEGNTELFPRWAK